MSSEIDTPTNPEGAGTSPAAPGSSSTPNIPTRLNNPGDLRYIGQAGGTPDPSGFASFPDPQTGFAALMNDVQSKINANPDHTIADFANTYAPNSDGNDSAQYAANLANKLGVPPDTKLSALQGNIGAFAQAIGNNEGYNDSNSSSSDNGVAPSTSSPMSTGEKIALGLSIPLTAAAGFFTGGATDAAIPEEVAALGGTEAATADAGAPGFLSKVGSVLKNAATSKIGTLAEGVGLGSVPGIVSNVFGGNSASATAANAQTEANATQSAATTEANATQAAETQNAEEQETLADEAEVQKSLENSKGLFNAQREVLQAAPAGQTLFTNPAIQEGMQANATYGFLPQVNPSSGKLDSTVAMQKADDAVGDMAQSTSHVLDTEGKRAPIKDVETAANDYIDQYSNTPEEADAAKAAVARNISSYQNKYGKSSGGNMGLGAMERSKIGEYKAGKFDARTPSHESLAHRAMGVGFRNTVAKHTDHKELYKRALKVEADILKGKKVLKYLHGKKAPEKSSFLGNLGRHYGKYVGTYIGEKIGGPFGAVVGTMVGDSLVRSVDKRLGKSFFESKTGKKMVELAATKSATQRRAFVKAFKDAGVKVPQKLLSAPKPGAPRFSHGTGTTVHLGAKSGTTHEKEERKNPKIRMPQNSLRGPLSLPSPSSAHSHVLERISSKTLPTASTVRAHAAGTALTEREKFLGTRETKNAKMNRNTRIPLSQGLSRYKATGYPEKNK